MMLFDTALFLIVAFSAAAIVGYAHWQFEQQPTSLDTFRPVPGPAQTSGSSAQLSTGRFGEDLMLVAGFAQGDLPEVEEPGDCVASESARF